jgi:hypothetical protein
MLLLNLINDKINGINVISEYLKRAISRVNQNIINEGISAISVHILSTNEVKRLYAIAHQIINIANCLKLNHNTIGSSFSICTGILYCI